MMQSISKTSSARSVWLTPAVWAMFSLFGPLSAATLDVPHLGTVTMYPETALVENGRAVCAVVYSATDANVAACARMLAAELGTRCGVQIPLLPDSTVSAAHAAPISDTYRDTNLLIVGHVGNNRAVLPLYVQLFCGADAFYPGGKGYELRTVSNPWGTGQNCIVLGGSTPAGCRAAVAALLARVPKAAENTVRLPRLLDIVMDDPELEDGLEQLQAREGSDQYSFKPLSYQDERVLHKFTRPAWWYHWSGRPYWAKLAREYILEFSRLYRGHYVMSHYQMEGFYRAWDMLEEATVFSPDERRLIIQHLAETAIRNPHCDPTSPTNTGSRHTLAANISAYTKMSYLRRTIAQPSAWDDVLTRWRQGTDAFFEAALTGYRDGRDRYSCEDSMEMLLRWPLSEGRLAHFESGLARQGLQYALSYIDSLGYTCGLADYEEALPGLLYRQRGIEYHCALVGYVLRDPGMQWLREHVAACATGSAFGGLTPVFFEGIGKYTTKLAADPATTAYLTGVTALPVSARRYARLQREAEADGVALAPVSATVDKICFRSGFAPTDQYLLLQGLQTFADANTIPRFTDGGKIWLVHNTNASGCFWRNGVYVSNGRSVEAPPSACRLELLGRFPDFGISSTVVPDYRGMDWRRTILWQVGQWFLVLDRLSVRTPDQYVVQCVWRTPRDASWRSDRLLSSRQEDRVFRLCSSRPVHASAKRNAVPDGAARPFVLRQLQTGEFNAGQVLDFQNLLWVGAASSAAIYEPVRLGPDAVLVRSPQQKTALLAGLGGGEPVLGIGVDRGVYALSSSALYLAGVSHLSVDGDVFLASATPVTARIDLTNGTVTAGHDAAAVTAGSSTWQLVPQKQPVAIDEPRLQALTNSLRGKLALASATPPVAGDAAVDSAPPRSAKETNTVAAQPSALVLMATVDVSNNSRQEVSGLRIRCEGAEGEPAEAVDGVLPTAYGSLHWPPGRPAAFELTWDAPQALAEIRVYRGPLPSYTPDTPTVVENAGELEVTWRNPDGSWGERSCVTVDQRLLLTIRSKGEVAAQRYLALDATGVTAAGLRIAIPSVGKGTYDKVYVPEVEVLAATPGSVRIRQTLAYTLDTSGRRAVLVNAGDGSVSLVDGDGMLMWQHQFPGRVNLSTGDLDDDGAREVLAACFDGSVYALSSTGNVLWQTSLLDVRARAGGRFYPNGPTPFATGLWEPVDGERRVVVGGYCSMSVLDRHGKILQHLLTDGRCPSQVLQPALDLDGDGRREVVVLCGTNNAGDGRCEILRLGADGTLTRHTAMIPGGIPTCAALRHDDGVTLGVVSLGGDGFTGGAACIDLRAAIQATRRSYPVWKQVDGRPVGGALSHDVDGDGQTELVVAGLDGFVNVLDAVNGQSKGRHALGVLVRGLVVLGAGDDSRYVALTEAGLVLYDAFWKVCGNVPGHFCALTVLDPDRDTLATVTDTGELRIYTLASD